MKKKIGLIEYTMMFCILIGFQNIAYSQSTIEEEKYRLRLTQKVQEEKYKYKTVNELKNFKERIIKRDFKELNINNDNYIIAAVFHNQFDIVKLLAYWGANIQFKDALGNLINRYFYSYQYQKPNIEILKFLLEHQVNPNSVGYYSDTPIVTAAIYNDFEAIKLLVQHGANINAQLEETGMSALMYAVMLPDNQMADYLIAQGANIHITDIEGENLLIFAAYAGSLPNIKLLLDKGLSIDAIGAYGLTPLMMAAAQGHSDVVRYLLNNQAQVNQQNDYGNTALIAAANKGDLESVKILLKAGAEINKQNKLGLTALSYAIEESQQQVIDFLLSQGASLDIADSNGNTNRQREQSAKLAKEINIDNGTRRKIEFDPTQCGNTWDSYLYIQLKQVLFRIKPDQLDVHGGWYVQKSKQGGCKDRPAEEWFLTFYIDRKNDEISMLNKVTLYAYSIANNNYDGVIPLHEVSLTKYKKNIPCQYKDMAFILCTDSDRSSYWGWDKWAYRADKAIYPVFYNQPFVIYCGMYGYSTDCKIRYKERDFLIKYDFSTDRHNLKTVIDIDKQVRKQINEMIVKENK